MTARQLDLLFNDLHQEIKRINERVFNKICMSTFKWARSLLFLDTRYINFSQKRSKLCLYLITFIDIVYNPLGLYILFANTR